MSRRVLVVVAAVGALAFATKTARADDDAASTELFNAGRDLMKRGDYAAACPKLAESVRLKATVGALAKLAACEEHQKRLVAARARWLQALNLAQAIGDARAGEVAAELARIDKVVPKLSIAGALPADATIRIDALQLGAASLGVPIAVEPGRHVVSASAPGKKAWSTEIETKADGATTAVTIPALEDAAPEPSPAPTTPTAPATTIAPPLVPATTTTTIATDQVRRDDEARRGSWRTIGLVTAGAGVVAAGVGAYFGADASRKKSDAACSGTVCPSDASASKLADAKSAATASTILFIAGGALVAAGVAIWIVAPNKRDAQSARVEVAPTVGGAMLRASF